MISRIKCHIFCQWPRNIHNNLKFMSVFLKIGYVDIAPAIRIPLRGYQSATSPLSAI